MADEYKTDKIKFDWKRIFFILLGLGFFFFIHFSPPWKDAVDPMGKAFSLSKEGKASIGLAFTKTGLTRRLAYKMLEIVGERTGLILLGSCLITGGLALFMAHTAAAATVFPILMSIYALYGEDDKPTKFGNALL